MDGRTRQLSATPWTQGLGKHYDDLVIAATTRQLISDGYLSAFVAFAPSDPDLSSVSTIAGEFKQDELGKAMDKVAITGDIVATWQMRAENRPTLVYCVNRSHARHICERFIEAGVAAEYMDGETKRGDREETFDRFRSGETKVICNVGVLTTGVDLPHASCIIDAQPTKSRILFVQKIGRGLRTAAGKSNCLILDHAGNHLRLGLVTDIGQDRLDDGSERKNGTKAKAIAQPRLRLCRSCNAVLPHGAKSCFACGEPVIALASVRVEDGDLVELGARQSGKRVPADWEKKAFYSELKGLKKPGYKQGWVDFKFKERFGHWPPRSYSTLPTLDPSLATINWVRSRQIAWVRRRADG